MPVLALANAGTWDVSGTLAEIVTSLMDGNSILDSVLVTYFYLGEYPLGTAFVDDDRGTRFVGGLPDFQNSANSLAAGGFLTLLDGQQGTENLRFQEPFRLYANTVGGDLRLATLPTGKKCAAALIGDEFFLHSMDYTPYDSTATPSATTYLGYVAPNCEANDMVDDGTGLGCQAPMNDGDCKMLNQDFVFNMDADRCELPGGILFGDGYAASSRLAAAAASCVPTTKPRATERIATVKRATSCRIDGTAANRQRRSVRIMSERRRNDDGRRNVRRRQQCSPRPPRNPPPQRRKATTRAFRRKTPSSLTAAFSESFWRRTFCGTATPTLSPFRRMSAIRMTESGYSFNAGGRMDFHKDRWHLYWTAGQGSVNGDFGDFRYSSGGSYAADFWTATFSENASGEIVDYDLSLSANYGERRLEVVAGLPIAFAF